MQNKPVTSVAQSGNAFFMILMAVMLFAALAFTFSKGIQQGGENISNRKASLAASDIIAYGQKVSRAVEGVIAKGNSEGDISFENDTETGYENPDCDPLKKCRIFMADGTGLTWQRAPTGANNNEPYFFGTNQVGLASETLDPSQRDLVMMLPVKMSVCTLINEMTTRSVTWVSGGTLNEATKFTGDYTLPANTRISWTSTADEPDARPAGCFCKGSAPCDSSDSHYFYYVLHPRG